MVERILRDDLTILLHGLWFFCSCVRVSFLFDVCLRFGQVCLE